MREHNPALVALCDFGRDMCAFVVIVAFVAVVCLWAYSVGEPPPVAPV